MALQTGTRLGPYEILSPLGAGGMGEVYLARDGKLDRQVAIKVIPETMTRDPERVARFEREAKVLASLNHPNVAAIHGFDDANGTRFLVMEYVEGETLSQRLKSGPFPVEDALDVAKQIAEALEAAHEKGVIHRDLKPGNVMIRPDGTVKVLDFGLAKAMGEESSGSLPGDSPTITANYTRPGVILGTAAYMSPEQARGKPLDKRTDIWSFGVILYECLTGSMLFHGETATDSMGAIMHKEPDWSQLPAETPPTIHLLLRRCLAKDRKKRLQHIGDARVELDEAVSDPTGSSLGLALATIDAAAHPKLRKRNSAVVLLMTVVLLAAGIAAGWFLKPSRSNRGRIVTEIPAPPDSRFIYAGDTAGPAIVSPNGRMIAFVAQQSGKRQQIWLRYLGENKAQPLRGTERAEFPFWSPDGQSIGFFASGHLMRVELATRTTQTVCDIVGGRGGTWLTSDTIVFSPEFQSGLFQVPASGGVPKPVTEIDAALHTSHRWPARVGDGNHFLFTAIHHDPRNVKEDAIYLGSLDGKPPRTVTRNSMNAEYACGKMLFVRDSVLMSVAIDLGTGAMLGRPGPIASDVVSDFSTWRAAFSASSSGVLAYHRLEQAENEKAAANVLAIGAGSESNVIIRYNRIGRPTDRIAEGLGQFGGRLSPGGQGIAVSIFSDQEFGVDLWIFTKSDYPPQRVTSMPSVEANPVWSPDGTELVFSHMFVGDGNDTIYRKAIGGGMARALVEATSDEQIWATDWSRDGKHLVYVTGRVVAQSNTDIHVLPLDGGDPFPYVATSENEAGARLSPNGKWLAYHASATMDWEVYVVPFTPEEPPKIQTDKRTAALPGKWQISVGGGTDPCWRADGKELYYMSTDGDVVAVSVDTEGDTFVVSTTTRLFQAPLFEPGKAFDVAPDGESFFIGEVSVNIDTSITLIVNWDQDPKQ